MRCSCPKCKADITEDFPEIPAEGIFLACPHCSANFNLKKESFARRALHKENEISCAECGSAPGHSIYCQNCHAIYPDYLVTETSSAAKKQLGKLLRMLNTLNRSSVHHHKGHAATQVPQKKIVIKGIKLPGQPVQLAATLIILVALIGGSGVFFYLNKIESEYTSSYVKALFVIKSAEDFNNKICDKISTDWKTKVSAAPPAPSAAEMTFLVRGLKDTETVMSKINKTPEKYLASKDSLMKLLEIYKKHQTLAVSPSGGPDIFNVSSKKLSDDFRKEAATLKAGLPEKLSDKLTEFKAKHKEMTDF